MTTIHTSRLARDPRTACACALVVVITLGCSGNRSSEEALQKQFPDLANAVTDRDRAQASTEIARTDGNGDGIVTEDEWRASGYQPVERFQKNDLSGDGILTPYEHSLRWTQYRLERERA